MNILYEPFSRSGLRAFVTINAVIVAITALAGAPAMAKTLYVDASGGNDSTSYADNSSDNPWATLGRALWGNSSHGNPNASQAAQAGDTVLVSAGTYNTNAVTDSRYTPIYNPVNSGRSGSPITIRAVGTVNLQSSNSSGAQPIVGTLEREHIVWDGFTVNERTVPTRRDTGPVVIWNSSNITMQNMHVIGMVQNWGDNHNGIRIENSNNIAVRNSRVEGFNESHGGNITTYNVSHLLLEHNDLSDAEDGIFIKGNNPGPVTIRYNYVHNTKNAIMFGIIGTSGQMSYVYQNLVVDASLGGVIFIGYNSSTPAHVTVANNTIHDASPSSDGGGILLRPEYSGYRNIIFRNNIVTGSAAGVTAWGDQLNALSFSHNNYYNNSRVAWIGYQDYSLSAWRSTYGKDTAGSLTTNPQFRSNSDFRLASGSPMVDAGLDILDLDNDGSTSDSISIGAYVTGTEIIGIDPNLAPNTDTPTVVTPRPPTIISVEQ